MKTDSPTNGPCWPRAGTFPHPSRRRRPRLPLLNYSGTVSYRSPWHRGEIVTAEATGITKAELARLHSDYKGTRVSACGTHRVRTAVLKGHSLCIVYLTDSKQHPRPRPEVVELTKQIEDKAREVAMLRKIAELEARQERREANAPTEEEKAKESAFDALKGVARAGVKVVTAPQLFPTPPEIARRVVELAGIEPGHTVLEPSAGTGH